MTVDEVDTADTVVVPLYSAETLPCPRLAAAALAPTDDLTAEGQATLRMPTHELAALVRQCLPTDAEMRAPSPPPLPARRMIGRAATGHAGPDTLPLGRSWGRSWGHSRGYNDTLGIMPTQLWLGSAIGSGRDERDLSAPSPSARPRARAGLWARLFRWLAARFKVPAATSGRGSGKSPRHTAPASGNSLDGGRFALASPPWSAYPARHQPRFRQVRRCPLPRRSPHPQS
jgi:hypothetical protein